MKISYNWLKDYVEIKETPQTLCDILTMAGLEMVVAEKLGDDYALETEVTTNRPDLLSLIGVAREIAAIMGRKVKIPKVSSKLKVQSLKWAAVEVEDKNGCPRYTARLIKDVKVTASADWLVKRLNNIGLRPVNNIVDITNFCLFELGHPMHAFDFDKLAGKKIIVRRAKDGERITSIDGIERKLDRDILIIADERRPVAIAGIMGSKDTEVSFQTKNVLLESACFDPILTRRASRKLSLTSESSYRFERGVDISTVCLASDRATDLICQLAKTTSAGRIIDIYQKKAYAKKKNIILRILRTQSILGKEIKREKAKGILASLGLGVKSVSNDKLTVGIPTPRQSDLKREIDLIEEIARIDGFDNLPTTVPAIVPKASRPFSDAFYFRKITKDILISLGFNEVITYSLVNPQKYPKQENNDIVGIENPLSSEQQSMRTNILGAILGVTGWNINRKQQDLKLFEISNVYFRKENKFIEKQNLCIAACGKKFDNWQDKAIGFSIFDLKGAIEEIFNRLGVTNYRFDDKDFSEMFVEGVSIYIKDKHIGSLGALDTSILSKFDIETEVFACEIDFDMLSDHIALDKAYKQIPKFPSILRDVSLSIDKAIRHKDIASLIKENGGPLLVDIKLQDLYIGPQIPQNEKGLLYRVEFQSKERTLREQEINEAVGNIRDALVKTLGAHLR